MDRKARKNRPKKKEMSPETWDNQLDNIRKMYEYGGKRKEKEIQPSSGNSEEK